MATGVPKKRRFSNKNGSPGNGKPLEQFLLEYTGKKSKNEILGHPPSSIECVWQGMASDENRLYFGENAGILSLLSTDPAIAGKVRLIYIDPPFATQTAFHSRNHDHAYEDILSGPDYVEFLRTRLVLLHHLLAEDGSLYLHLDEKMAFHMKLVLDEVFGPDSYRNCITRKKCNSKNYTRKQYGNVIDYIFFYTKTKQYVWNRPLEPWTKERAKEYQYSEPETGRLFMKVPLHAPGVRHGKTGEPWRGILPPPGKHWQFPPHVLDEMDSRGEIYWSANNNPRRKVYLDENQGIGVQDIWLEFKDAHNQNVCITGYPTEKNSDLLKRIIEASSNPGDLVLDCFAGSGTTLDVASNLGRRWIGIDSSPEAIRTTLKRFAHGTKPMGDYVDRGSSEASTPSISPDLFTSLEPELEQATIVNHIPTKDFTFLVESTLVGAAQPLIRECEQFFGSPIRRSSTLEILSKAIGVLKSTDHRLAKIIEEVGPCRLAPYDNGFSALIDAIISQQLSKKAADTIRGRVKALFRSARPNAEELLSLSPSRLKAAGLSKRKIGFLRDLAANVANGKLDLTSLAQLSNEDIVDQLTSVRGIGRWTADMYLIFTLNRLDVFPSSDLALKESMRRIYKIRKGSSTEQYLRISRAWQPFRSVACWYLYSHLNRNRESVGPSSQQTLPRVNRNALKNSVGQDSKESRAIFMQVT